MRGSVYTNQLDHLALANDDPTLPHWATLLETVVHARQASHPNSALVIFTSIPGNCMPYAACLRQFCAALTEPDYHPLLKDLPPFPLENAFIQLQGVGMESELGRNYVIKEPTSVRLDLLLEVMNNPDIMTGQDASKYSDEIRFIKGCVIEMELRRLPGVGLSRRNTPLQKLSQPSQGRDTLAFDRVFLNDVEQ